MNTYLRRSLFLALLLATIPALLLAQGQTSGAISGKIVDEEGNAVVGAVITVNSTDTGLERESKSDRNGQFQFNLLPVGNWSVTIVAEGLQPQVYSFRLGVGENVPIESTLLPGELIAEEVTVFSTATAMEQTHTGENLDYRQAIEELPVEDRRLNVVARLAGHVSDATQTGIALTIAGAPSYDTTVLLDGAEISDPFFGTGTTVYLEDAIEEVQVLTSGISARYGRFQGGVINAITKSGSNQFEATVRYEFDKESWNEQTPFGETQSDDLNETYQATAGGYFLKDRAWFFGGYREIPATSNARTTGFTNQGFTTAATEDRWQLKLRGAPASNHIVDVSHLEFEASTDPWAATNLNPGHLQAVAGARGDPRETNTGTYQGVLTPSLFLELQATEKQAAIFAGGDPSTGNHPFIDWSTFDVFNNYWWDASDLDVRDNETMAGNLTYALATDNAGTHSIEGGVQYVKSTTGGENKQSPTDFNLIGFNSDFISGSSPDGEPLFNIRNGVTERWKALPIGGSQQIENTAVYVQDTISAGKWRFDVGLRYDDYTAAGPLPRFNMAFDDIAPRLGVTYNISDSWQLVGTWGRYISRFNDNYVQGATQVGTAPSIDHLYSGPDALGLTAAQANAIVGDDSLWTILSSFSGPGIPTEYLAANISAPFAEDLQLSLRKALPRNAGTVVFSFIDRDFNDLLTDFVGGVCEYGFPFSHQAASCPDANFTDVLGADGGVIGQVDTTVWANSDIAQRRYQGFSLQADYRPAAKWGLGGSYTFSETTGNYEGEGENTPAGGGTLGAFPRSKLPNFSPFGRLDEDLRHRVRAWGQYRLGFGRAGSLALSGILSYQSGQNWTKQANVGYANDPGYLTDVGTYVHIFEREAGRFNDFRRLDFAARYEVPIFNRLALWVKVAVINLTNEDELLEFQTNGTAATVNGITQWAPTGSCGLNDAPSTSCSGFGRISDETFYQRPREYFFTVGLKY